MTDWMPCARIWLIRRNKNGSADCKHTDSRAVWLLSELGILSQPVTYIPPASNNRQNNLATCGAIILQSIRRENFEKTCISKALRAQKYSFFLFPIINKSYQRIDKQDLITEPKTPKSNRTIQLPKFLCEELQDYFRQIYGADETSRIFPVTKHYLRHEMIRGCQETGVKEIRLHDLRHSHVSLLIDMGFSALAIADRVGHETIDITYRYAHLFPSKQRQMADQLDFERGGEYVTEMPGSKGTLAE